LLKHQYPEGGNTFPEMCETYFAEMSENFEHWTGTYATTRRLQNIGGGQFFLHIIVLNQGN
jgi:hypothetical protein